jgi:fructose-1,6-bisphosphatase/inositol monophosphatase family enzyme
MSRYQTALFQHSELAQQKKLDKTLVTMADYEINQMMIAYFRTRYPELDIMGEEESNRCAGAPYQLVCDPVDGTTQFANGLASANFILSLLKDGVPQCAVVYEPLHIRQPLWYAERRRGAFLQCIGAQPRKLHTSSVPSLRDGHLFVSYWSASRYNLARFHAQCLKAGVSVQEATAMGGNGVRVAFGTTAATVYAGSSGLEAAACALIVEEAGGRATDIRGNPLVFSNDCTVDGHVLSNGIVHDELVDVLSGYLDEH